tara:strand:+ start:1785 stop:5468 length:3684 start_codon:yes stop_codon:yes gene_type:complete
MATRQDVLFAAEDYIAKYQSFDQSNFQAYDFDTLKSAMVDFIRLNYPEDYNDWIQSSEFVSLMDLIAFVGHNTAFRTDFATRENFMETAQSRDSILRLARFLGYNPTRSKNSSGILKIKTIRTTESLIDSDGENLSNTDVIWNDSTNANAYEQFIMIMNSAFGGTTQFGTPYKSLTLNGIKNEIYKLNSLTQQQVVYPFSATIQGSAISFEVCNVDIASTGHFEPIPDPASSLNCVYLNDGKGNSSAKTGFFFYFKQGTLELSDTLITNPIENQVIDIDTENITNDDVWVQTIDQDGTVIANWTAVESVVGSNVIFNAVNNNVRDIYQVVTRSSDAISIKFADGRFGNAPKGIIRTWFRSGNGEEYTIRTDDIQGQQITIPYYSKHDQQLYDLVLTFDLEEPIKNSTVTESNTSIKTKAPLVYSTQNRMVSATDYAVYPLQASTNITKIKSTNRVHSGHTRYVDINDPTGTYKDLTIFGDDGYVFEEETFLRKTLATTTGLNSTDIIDQFLQTLLDETQVENFYYQKYKTDFVWAEGDSTDSLYYKTSDETAQDANMWTWKKVTGTTKQSTGYFTHGVTNPLMTPIGPDASNTVSKFLIEGANIEFAQVDANNQFVENSETIWASITGLYGDGRGITNAGLSYTGKTKEGYGTVTLSRNIPDGLRIKRIAPAFNRKFSAAEITAIKTQLDANNSFGIRWDHRNNQYDVILGVDLGASQSTAFSLIESTAGTQSDNSYLIRVEYHSDQWIFLARCIKYNFGSVNNVRFYDQRLTNKISKVTKKSTKDNIRILNINLGPLPTWSSSTSYATGDKVVYNGTQYSAVSAQSNQTPSATSTFWSIDTAGTGLSTTLLPADYDFDIEGFYTYDDGYTDPRRVLLKFADTNKDYVIDDPFAFDSVVGANRIFITDTQDGNYTYKTLMTDTPPQKTDGTIKYWESATSYALTEKVEYNGSEYESKIAGNLGILPSDTTNWKYIRDLSYQQFVGRSDIRFKWAHAASEDTRIDPAVTNIIDTFVLTTTYNTEFRNWLKNDRRAQYKPLPHTTEDLNIMFLSLEDAKTSSDTIIYKSCDYKILFGTEADYALQAKFKVVKNPITSLTDNEIKATIVDYIDEYFEPTNWDFGETFYFTELASYVHRNMIGIISSFVIVPINSDSRFGNMFQVTPDANELFISAAKVSDIDIVDSYTETNIRIASGLIETPTATTSIVGTATSTSSSSSSSSGSSGGTY